MKSLITTISAATMRRLRLGLAVLAMVLVAVAVGIGLATYRASGCWVTVGFAGCRRAVAP